VLRRRPGIDVFARNNVLTMLPVTIERQPVAIRLPVRVDNANEARVRLDLLAILHAIAPHVSGLVLDMTRTSVIDSSGLRALRTVQGHADELEVAFCLAAPREDVRRLLRLADIAGRIPVFANVGAALTGWSANHPSALLPADPR
jgi:anti-anti-sigma factor